MHGKIPQRGEIVLEPEDDKGDTQKVLQDAQPRAGVLVQFIGHYIQVVTLFQNQDRGHRTQHPRPEMSGLSFL
jgi:hypothetical protein